MRLADVHCTEHGSAEVAALTGEIDISNTERIGRAVTQAMSNRSLALILDLSEVDFIDSAGIRLIYQLREDLRARGQALRLVIPSGSPTTEALNLAGVIGHIAITETVEAALQEASIRDARGTQAGR